MKHLISSDLTATSSSAAASGGSLAGLQLPSALKRSAVVLCAVLAASILTGCEPRRHHHNPTVPQPDRFVELEPNDSPFYPDFVGVLGLDSFLVVEGSVEAIGFDIVDHIEFESNGPLEIDFTLEAYGAFGDVDVTIYDPIDDVVVAVYASSGRFETGTIIVHDAGRPFQFIIEAYDVDADWDLELITYPHGCACRTAGNGPEGAETPSLDHEAELKDRKETLPAISALKSEDVNRLD